MVINSTNINKANNHLSYSQNSLNSKRPQLMTLEILAWDRHTNVVGFNRGLLWLPNSRSQTNRQVPVLKARSQLKFLQRANFFEPKLWMIAFTTTSFLYKWSGFVCTNVNVCIQGRIQDFKLGGGTLKKIAPSGGKRKIFLGYFV